jgi:hypothetical protein
MNVVRVVARCAIVSEPSPDSRRIKTDDTGECGAWDRRIPDRGRDGPDLEKSASHGGAAK